MRLKCEDYICVDDLVDGHIYLVYARGFNHAIWYNRQFWGVRQEFNLWVTSSQNHWDDEHGTVKPIKLLDKNIDSPDVESVSKYICKENLEPGMAYQVSGRNFSSAIWDGKSFLGARYKFGLMLDNENHWDDGEDNHGTVKPIKVL